MSKVQKKEVVVDGVTYVVCRPNARQNSEATLESAKAFNEALQKGALVKVKIRELMKTQGIWNEETDAEVKDLQDKLYKAEQTLVKGAKSGLNKKQARDLALDMRGWRNRLLELRLIETDYDSKTAESFAENAKFDYLVSVCTFKENGDRVFSSLEDYRNKADEEYASKCASTLAEIVYGSVSDFGKDLPENLFLKNYGFVNDKGRLVNAEGKLVDTEGNLINEEGFYVDAEGRKIDKNGNLLDENGNLAKAPDFEEFPDA